MRPQTVGCRPGSTAGAEGVVPEGIGLGSLPEELTPSHTFGTPNPGGGATVGFHAAAPLAAQSSALGVADFL